MADFHCKLPLMRWTVPVLVACLSAACGYQNTTAATAAAIPTPSSSAASIRVLASTRPDRRLDVSAIVLTADGHGVAGAPVVFASTGGTLTASSATTDANGAASTILANTTNVKVSASTGALQATIDVTTSVQPPTVETPPTTPTTPVTPVPATPFTVSLSVTPGGAGAVTTLGAAGAGMVSETWNFGDGSSSVTTAIGATTHVYGIGQFTASVVATNSAGEIASATRTFTIAAAPISVSLGASPNQVTLGGSIRFTIASTAGIGAAFTFGDGAPAVTTVGGTVNHVYAALGSYVAGVTVADSFGQTATATANVSVVAPPPPPPPTTLALTVTVTCSGLAHGAQTSCNIAAVDETGAIVPSNTITAATWDFGDSVVDAGTYRVLAQHTFSQAGTYRIVVTAFGALGRSGTATATVIIT